MKKALLFLAVALLAAPAMAQEAAEAAAPAATNLAASMGTSVGLAALAVGFLMGIAVLGGTLGQSRAATAALDGIARNPAAAPKLQLPLILALALMESLVLFAFVIGNNITGAIVAAVSLIK